MKTFFFQGRCIPPEKLNKRIEAIIKRKSKKLNERFIDDIIGDVWIEILVENPDEVVFLGKEDLFRFVDRIVKRNQRIQQQENGKSNLPSLEQLSVVEDRIGITEPLFFNHPPVNRRKSSYLTYGDDGKAIDHLSILESQVDTTFLSKHVGNSPNPVKTTLKLLKHHSPSVIPRTLEDAADLVSQWSDPWTGKSPNRGERNNFSSRNLEGQTIYFNAGCPICLNNDNSFQIYHDERKGLKWKCWRFIDSDDQTTDLIPNVPKDMKTLATILDLQGRDDFDLRSLKISKAS